MHSCPFAEIISGSLSIKFTLIAFEIIGAKSGKVTRKV